MAKRKESGNWPTVKASKAIPVKRGKDDAEAHRNLAATMTSPEVAAYRVVAASEVKSGVGEMLDTPAMIAELKARAARVNSGDLSEQEAMLANQAIALQTLFTRLTEFAMGADLLVKFEAYMRLALRAQAQSRATIETLSTIKNPPVVFAKQANVANQQIVNNGPRAGETEATQTKLLEAQHGERLDTGTKGTAGGAHPQLAAVETINRAKVTRGQGQGVAERLQGRDASDAA